MSKQLSIFDVVEDGKRQAIQRYLNRAKAEPTASISRYSPSGRKAEYYRLVFRNNKKVRAVHIKGGNCSARLSNYRAKRLQVMIDRGAELREILEQLADFNGGTSKNDN